MKTRTIIFFAAFLLVMLGCQLTGSVATPTVAAPQPAATATSIPCNTGEVCFDFSAVGTGAPLEMVDAVPAAPDAPFWEGSPQYRRYSLAGYPVTGHQYEPRIHVYAVADMAAVHPAWAQFAGDLKTLLETHSAGKQLPILPLSPEGQLIRSRMEFVSFKNGQGVQFLTQLGQGLTVINNHQFIFTFQGLTYDGKYYVSVIFPITNPALPANDEITDELRNKLLEDFPSYLSATIDLLDKEPAANFTPNLNSLSALIRSIEVR